MTNITLIVGLHLAACVFLVYMISGLVLDGLVGFNFTQSVLVSSVIVVLSWLANIIIEASKMSRLADTAMDSGVNLDVILSDTDAQDSEPEGRDRDNKDEVAATSSRITA